MTLPLLNISNGFVCVTGTGLIAGIGVSVKVSVGSIVGVITGVSVGLSVVAVKDDVAIGEVVSVCVGADVSEATTTGVGVAGCRSQ